MRWLIYEQNTVPFPSFLLAMLICYVDLLMIGHCATVADGGEFRWSQHRWYRRHTAANRAREGNDGCGPGKLDASRRRRADHRQGRKEKLPACKASWVKWLVNQGS
jgi:hypothetical protein